MQSLFYTGFVQSYSFMKDGKGTWEDGMVTFHTTEGTSWEANIIEKLFDSYGSPPPKLLLDFIL